MVTIGDMERHSDSLLIDRLGGNGTLAAMFGISSQAVSKWRRIGIPKAPRMYLELRYPAEFGGSASSTGDDSIVSSAPSGGIGEKTVFDPAGKPQGMEGV